MSEPRVDISKGGWPAMSYSDGRVWLMSSAGGKWTCDACGKSTTSKDPATVHAFAKEHAACG